MNICSDGHDEICYNGAICPLCDMRDDLEETIDFLEEDIGKLKIEVESLESQLGDI